MNRTSQYPIENLLLNRKSLRAMSGEAITNAQLMPLFEAARWAPSSFNSQPWQFFYAYKGTNYWDLFFNLLVPFNQEWVQRAGALIIIVSQKNSEGRPLPTHSFDTGAAWENLALQGTKQGLIVHAMSGFNYEKAFEVLKLSERYAVECMVAVGHPGPLNILSATLQAREVPSERKTISEIAFEGINKTIDQ